MIRLSFASRLVAGKLLGRRKRFFADVEVGGRVVVAHCPNPGSMRGNLAPGSSVWLEDRAKLGKPGLPFRWVAVAPPGTDPDDVAADWICVDTGLANPAVAAVLRAGEFPGIGCIRGLSPEYTVDVSRLDFQVWPATTEMPTYIEVKSVSLRTQALGNSTLADFAFPDSPTERGRKHLELLAELSLAGERTLLCFAVIANKAQKLRVADEIDPEYGRVLRDARDMGVGVSAVKFSIDREGISYAGGVEFCWDWYGQGSERKVLEAEGRGATRARV